MGPTLFLGLLLLIMSEMSLTQCEANAITVGNSSDSSSNDTMVPANNIGGNNTDIIGSGNNSDISTSPDGHHDHPVPVTIVTSVPVTVNSTHIGNGSLANNSSSSTNGTEVIKVILDEELTAPPARKPCALRKHHDEDDDDDDDDDEDDDEDDKTGHKKKKVSHHGNGNDKNGNGTSASVKVKKFNIT